MAWPGGKDGAGVYQRLINQIPPHDVFVSAFLGDCAILRRKLPAATSVGIDRQRSNLDRWTAEQSLPGLRLYHGCGIAWLRHAFELDLVGTHDSAAAAAESGGSQGRSRRRSSPPAAGEVAQFGGPDRRWFVYADPPYLLDSRRSRRKLYAHELTEDDHVELLATLARLPCHVMVSHYPHPLYARSLAGWRTFTYQAQTRGGRPATEQVWCNYPAPAELHDPRFVGGNKRERERVRRRVRNWIGGLERMQPDERQAVLDAIAARGFRQEAPL